MVLSEVVSTCKLGFYVQSLQLSTDLKRRREGAVLSVAEGYFGMYHKTRKVFKDWRMVWDERCTSRSPQEPHLAADCIKDTFGKVERDDKNKRTRVGGTFEGPILSNVCRRTLADWSDHYERLLHKNGLEQDAFESDRSKRGV